MLDKTVQTEWLSLKNCTQLIGHDIKLIGHEIKENTELAEHETGIDNASLYLVK